MKNFIIGVVCIFVFMYLLFAFMKWNFNPQFWGEQTRDTCISISITLNIGWFLIHRLEGGFDK